MKKIEIKSEIEKKDRSRRIIVGVILVMLLVIGTLGYGFLSRQEAGGTNSKKELYNGREFVMTDSGYWYAAISGYGFYFQHLPKEAENISAPFARLEEYYYKPLFFVFNDGDAAAKSEIYRSLKDFTSAYPQDACLLGEECKNLDLPVENCSSNIIIFNVKNETSISREENCIFIESQADDMTRAADAFLYRILGVQ
ncbi:hypothetical protein HYT26_00525 [Candidatus Pacearchaeota archaeon]|nr:hypothetical protein [Candidatus Pacearchaeota archaeon]